MSNDKLTEMIFILDRSGSMCHLVGDTIGGFNSLIMAQREEDFKSQTQTKVTTVLFDDQYEVLHDAVDIQDLKDLDKSQYFTRGATALLDAVGKCLSDVSTRLQNTPDNEKPGHTIVTIITDGHENSSVEYNKNKIQEMIKLHEDEYKWLFNFLGANIDAFSEGGEMGLGIAACSNFQASAKGMAANFMAVRSRSLSYRNDAEIQTMGAAYACAFDSIDTDDGDSGDSKLPVNSNSSSPTPSGENSSSTGA